jgi:hypothetical protein
MSIACKPRVDLPSLIALQLQCLQQWSARNVPTPATGSGAGKTTLTEKLLLFGCAIQLAGEVEARGKGWWIPPPLAGSRAGEPL